MNDHAKSARLGGRHNHIGRPKQRDGQGHNGPEDTGQNKNIVNELREADSA